MRPTPADTNGLRPGNFKERNAAAKRLASGVAAFWYVPRNSFNCGYISSRRTAAGMAVSRSSSKAARTKVACATSRRKFGASVLLRAASLINSTGIALLKAFAPSRSKNFSAPLVVSFVALSSSGISRPSLSSLKPAGTRGAVWRNSSRFCARDVLCDNKRFREDGDNCDRSPART